MDFKDLLRARPLIAQHLRQDLGAFVRNAWSVMHPGAKLHWNWHLDLLCEYLTLVKSREVRRLLVNVPPRTAKTTVASIAFPVWCWLDDPALSFLCASYELDLADTHNLARRRLIESSWFQGLFADRFRLSSDRSLVSEFTSDRGGAMLSASVNSRAMGRGGDVVIIDDPLSADAAYSDIFRQQVNEWFEHMLPQRLNDPASSPIVLIMQRLHEADAAGFVLEREPGEWTHVRLPLVSEQDEVWEFPITKRVVTRKAGECLDSKRFPPKVVKARQGNRVVWASQFQQRPAPLEGNLVRVSDIQFFGGRHPETGQRDMDLPATFDRKVISVDAAFKAKSTSDYVVVLVIGILGSRRFVIHVSRAHMDLDTTECEIRHCHQVFGPISAVLVEDAANGASVVAHLKENIAGVIPVTPAGGKMSRMMAAAPEFMAHDWFVERGALWTNELITELTLFPSARHDDLVDAVSQAAIWLQQNTYEFGFLDYLKSLATGKSKVPASPEEIKAANPGPVEARSVGRRNAIENPPPCKACGGPCIWQSPAAPGMALRAYCNQCHRYDGAAVGGAELGCEFWCPAFLPQIVTGRIRCGNCGRYHDQVLPTLGAVSRSQYEAARSDFPEWDRLKRFR